MSTALHAGFQLTVTLVVYPALADVQPNLWAAAHARHSRRITPLVALVYGAALTCCVGVLINSGGNTTTQLAGMVMAIAGTAAAIALTAFCAGPTHRRLDSGLDPVLVGRLRTLRPMAHGRRRAGTWRRRALGDRITPSGYCCASAPAAPPKRSDPVAGMLPAPGRQDRSEPPVSGMTFTIPLGNSTSSGTPTKIERSAAPAT